MYLFKETSQLGIYHLNILFPLLKTVLLESFLNNYREREGREGVGRGRKRIKKINSHIW